MATPRPVRDSIRTINRDHSCTRCWQRIGRVWTESDHESLPDATWVDLGITGRAVTAALRRGTGGDHRCRAHRLLPRQRARVLNGWIPEHLGHEQHLGPHQNDGADLQRQGKRQPPDVRSLGSRLPEHGRAARNHLHNSVTASTSRRKRLDQPVEAFADVAASSSAARLCAGPGSHFTNCSGYGDTCLDCTGIGDQDWDAHTAHQPADLSWRRRTAGAKRPLVHALNYEAHCEGAIAAEAV